MSTGTPYVMALQAVLDRVTYKQGWAMSVMLHGDESWCINLLVDHHAPNAYPSEREKVLVYRLKTVPPRLYTPHLEPDAFIRWVLMTVSELELHEVDEWFKVDGVHFTDPHPEMA